MSEERVNNLAELYDRTRKCTGITVPKDCAILLDFCRDDIETIENHASCSNAEWAISDLISLVADELMVAGVEEIYIIPWAVPYDEESKELKEALDRKLNNFRDSVRPNAKIKISAQPREYRECYGEFESAIIIRGNRDNEVPKALLNMFVSKKTIMLHTFVRNTKDLLAFAGEICSWNQQIATSNRTFDVTFRENDNRFTADYRVVTQAIFMLCSDELGSKCFGDVPQIFNVFKIDGEILQNIFGKFALQGVLKQEVFNRHSEEYFQTLIEFACEFGGTSRSRSRINGRIYANYSGNANDFLPGGTWVESASSWSADDYSELINNERRIAHPEAVVIDTAENTTNGEDAEPMDSLDEAEDGAATEQTIPV